MKVLLLLLLLPLLSVAQFTSAEVGVNGLTCSACSRSVEMSIRKLDFVKDIQMDLTNTQGKITFKEGVHVSIDKIAKAVTDAGFSVRYLSASLVFDSITVSDNNCFNHESSNYQFVNAITKKLSGTITLKFIGKEFLPPKEYKNWNKLLKNKCVNDKQKTYYVSL